MIHFRQYFFGIMLLCGTGCTSLFQTAPLSAISLPHEREFRQGSLIFHSDASVSENHPLFLELASFPEQVCRILELPVTDRTIHVYLFKDRASFEQYVHMEFKDIPSRRALFVQRPAESIQKKDTLQVLCFWGDRIQDDLRHELTHATLHSVLREVPLWIDEGLAMYFETGVASQGKHSRVLSGLEPELREGKWKNDLNRLASLKEVNQMGLADYQEAWAWVYYQMQSTPANRALLLTTLKGREDQGLVKKLESETRQMELLLKKLIAERGSWPHG